MRKLLVHTAIAIVLSLGTVTSAATDAYGLFVGIDYGGLRYDLAAEDLYNAFSKNVANFRGIVPPVTGTEITEQQVWQSAGPLYSRMDSDDILVVYMGGHGGQGLYDLRWEYGETGETTTQTTGEISRNSTKGGWRTCPALSGFLHLLRKMAWVTPDDGAMAISLRFCAKPWIGISGAIRLLLAKTRS